MECQSVKIGPIRQCTYRVQTNSLFCFIQSDIYKLLYAEDSSLSARKLHLQQAHTFRQSERESDRPEDNFHSLSQMSWRVSISSFSSVSSLFNEYSVHLLVFIRVLWAIDTYTSTFMIVGRIA